MLKETQFGWVFFIYKPNWFELMLIPSLGQMENNNITKLDN